MRPPASPNASSMTFTMGTKQLVVQDTLETISCTLGSKWESFTPTITVTSASRAGAEMITREAPPFRCPLASAREVNTPVDSMTTSTPSSSQGRFDGSRSLSTAKRRSPTTRSVPSTATGTPEHAPRRVVAEQLRRGCPGR